MALVASASRAACGERRRRGFVTSDKCGGGRGSNCMRARAGSRAGHYSTRLRLFCVLDCRSSPWMLAKLNAQWPLGGLSACEPVELEGQEGQVSNLQPAAVQRDLSLIKLLRIPKQFTSIPKCKTSNLSATRFCGACRGLCTERARFRSGPALTCSD
eukprot:6192344-Pleurochrysis_carterae.AAC.1